MSSIREEFVKYAERMAEIKRLSSPDIKVFDSADDYSERLRFNFQRIGRLAAQNREMLDQELYPILNSNDALTKEEEEELKNLSDMLLNVAGIDAEFENLDLPISSLITERLLYDANEKHDLITGIRRMDDEIAVCYSLMNMTERITTHPDISGKYRNRGLAIGKVFISLLNKDKFLTISDKECRAMVLTNSRFTSTFFERVTDPEKNQENIDILRQMLNVASDGFYRDAVPDYDWDYFEFRVFEYYTQLTDACNERCFPEDVLSEIAAKANEFDSMLKRSPEVYCNYIGYSFAPLAIARCRYLAGELTLEEYTHIILDAYERRDRLDFDTEGCYFNVLLPLEYICLIDKDRITMEEVTRLRDIYVSLNAYLFRLPADGSMSFVMEYVSGIISRFIEIPSVISAEDFILNCMAAIHPPIYVHSEMVGQITERLCMHLISQIPELFIGMEGCRSSADVLANRDAIIDYAYHAAICHDFGKIYIIDTIFVYGRKLLDFEFDIIKAHPVMGSELLKMFNSTRRYADVALGHHKWYDDSRGYPDGFSSMDSPYRTIMNIVQCADCLDAATDTVGRSYNKGKKIEDFTAELREGAGTRYAPWLADLFEKEEVRSDIKYLLSEGRMRNYRETYSLLKNVQDNG